MIADEKVRVRFVTEHEEYRITDAPFSLPSKLGRSGLSEVINHLLNLDEPVSFDFIINDHLIRTPLQKFLAVHRVSTETIIRIEYFPATSMSDESQTAEGPSWVGCINTSIDKLIITGCYDGTAKIFNSNDLSEVSTVLAHQDPVRAITCWNMSSSSDKKQKPVNINYMATASKDQTVKCWDLSDINNVTHVATLSGHINSVESLGVWRPRTGQSTGKDTILVTGDWAGTLFGWNVSQLGAEVPVSKDAVDSQDKKKRKKAADFMGVSGAGASVNTTMKPLFTIKAHAQAVSGICSSRAAGQHNSIFTCSWDHAVKEWDLERQDCVTTFASSRVVTSVDCSTDATSSMLLATSHPDGKVRVWDPRQSGEASAPKVTLGKTAQWISQVKWRPDSAIVLSATDYEGNVSLWDIRSNAVPLGVSEVHGGKALCVDWAHVPSADDSSVMEYKVVSGGSDCCVKATAVHQ